MISVLMGVHEISEFVFPSIDSILSQDGVLLEIILVANGKSSVNVANALKEAYWDDERVKVLESPIGQLSHALNLGLSHARYEYIARMDADDISHSGRLQRQLAFIETTGNDIIGGMLRLIDINDKEIGIRRYPQGNAINRLLPFKNCFAHNTIIARKQILLDVGGYCGGFNNEDYSLWTRLQRHGVKWENMSDTLVDYRIHEGASQKRLLGYAESAGVKIRELMLSKNPVWILGILKTIIAAVLRSR